MLQTCVVVYCLQCPDCDHHYITETARPLYTCELKNTYIVSQTHISDKRTQVENRPPVFNEECKNPSLLELSGRPST